MKTCIAELNLLIVDDSIAQRQYAQKICGDLGLHNVHHAENGIAALKIFQEKKIDVVLIDLEMPVMDGIELIRAIAQHHVATSVIIVSAKDPILISSVGTMAEADGLHLLGTFQKPLQMDLLKCSLLLFIQNSLAKQYPTETNPIEEITAVELCEAICNNEITLAYQPKLTVKGLLLRGVEALARWKHPVKGQIPPCTFIPLAERHGLIDALTRNIIETAFAQKKQWQELGLVFHIAVNLSPLSLSDKEIVEWLINLSKEYDIAPQDITFEITENALLKELASAIHTLARLRLKGFNIAIDDYGTGFANAQQLSRVPATELKLDRSLVHNAAIHPQQLTILASSIELAKKLKMQTVAEGAETIEDYNILVELGADQVQGFYFSKPLYPPEFLTFVKNGLNNIRQQHKL